MVGVFLTLLPREGMQAFPWLSHPWWASPNGPWWPWLRVWLQGHRGRALVPWREEGRSGSRRSGTGGGPDSLSFPDRDSIPSDLFRFPLTGSHDHDQPFEGLPPSHLLPGAVYTGGASGGARPGTPRRDSGVRPASWYRHHLLGRDGLVAAFGADGTCEALVREDLDICWMGAARADQLDDELLA